MAKSEEMCSSTSQEEFQLCVSPRQIQIVLNKLFLCWWY